MGVYDKFAKGIVLTHDIVNGSKPEDQDPAGFAATLAALEGADFLVVDMGWGTDYYPEFAQRLNLAARLGIPVVGRMKMDPGPYQQMGYGAERWPKADADLHIKTMDRAFFMGGTPAGAKRQVQAFLWDMTYNQDLTSKVFFTEVWMRGLSEYLLDLSWKRHRIPYYLFCTLKVMNDYGNKPGGQLATMFTGQPMSCLKKAFQADPAIMTVKKVSEIPTPPKVKDPETGQMVDQKPDYLYGARPFLWIYSGDKFYIEGFVDGKGKPAPIQPVLYWGSKEQLYDELNFTPANDTPEIPEPPAGGGGGDEGDGDGEPTGATAREIALLRQQVHEDLAEIGACLAPLHGLINWLLKLKG